MPAQVKGRRRHGTVGHEDVAEAMRSYCVYSMGIHRWRACEAASRAAQRRRIRPSGPELPAVYRWAYDYSLPGAEEDFIPQNRPSAAVPGEPPGRAPEEEPERRP